jgi:hypothetical protein
MRTAELETAFRDKLEQAGLMAALNEDQSQFLDLSGGFLAEIVLNDGSKLALAERTVRSVKEELEERGVAVDSIVRAVWAVKEINFIGAARALSGGIKAALEFEAMLESGNRQCRVSIELTLAALNKLREKLALPEKVGFPGWAKDGDVDEDTLRKMVAEFLDFQLSTGGASYWDPIRFPKLELKESAVSYLMPDSDAFKQLTSAVDDFLGDYAIEYSLRDLDSRGVRVLDFQRVLPDLSSHLGGPYKRGDQFAVSAVTLYQALGELERKRLHDHYLQKVAEIPENLKQRYPRIFDN